MGKLIPSADESTDERGRVVHTAAFEHEGGVVDNIVPAVSRFDPTAGRQTYARTSGEDHVVIKEESE